MWAPICFPNKTIILNGFKDSNSKADLALRGGVGNGLYVDIFPKFTCWVPKTRDITKMVTFETPDFSSFLRCIPYTAYMWFESLLESSRVTPAQYVRESTHIKMVRPMVARKPILFMAGFCQHRRVGGELQFSAFP